MKSAEFVLWVGLFSVAAAAALLGTADRTNWLLDAGWLLAGVPQSTAGRFNLAVALVVPVVGHPSS